MAASQGISDLWSRAEVTEVAERHLFSVALILKHNVDFIKTFSFSLGYATSRMHRQQQQRICIDMGDKGML